MVSRAFVSLLLVAHTTYALNFPYESIQLQKSEVGNNSDISFGNWSKVEKPTCKNFPGDDAWPSSSRWQAFNISLGGALLRAVPPAAACYEGEFKNEARCAAARRGQNDALFA